MKLLYIDTETTGLDYDSCAIWQLGGIIEIDGVEKERFDIHMRPNPEQNICIGALDATSTNLEKIIKDSISQYEGYTNFINILDNYINKYNKEDKFFMIGYNNHSFDSAFIRKFMLMHNNSYYGSYFWHPGIDVMLLAAYAAMSQRIRLPNFKLTTVAKSLGLEVDETKAHDAMYDIELTRSVFKLIKKEYPN